MERQNLDSYIGAWKREQVYSALTLSADQISSYLKKQTKSIAVQFRVGVWMDIIYKSILAAACLFFLLVYPGGATSNITALVILGLSLLGTGYQFYIKRLIAKGFDRTQNSREFLAASIAFYNRRYIKSILVSAGTNPLLFATGSLFYFQYNYGGIRPFELDDFIVFSLAIILAFGLSAWIYLNQYNFHISQLEESLSEINAGTIQKHTLQMQRKRRIRRIIASLLALVAGVLVISYFMFA